MAELEGAGGILARTATGSSWLIGWRMTTRLLGLISTFVLVRLLAPADFGLVALGSSFAASVDALSALGVEDALVRQKSPGRDLYDTGFTMNLVRAVLTAAILAAMSGPVGSFFKDDRLTNVLLALALGTFCTGFANIGTVDFSRQLRFDREFRLRVLPRIISVITTVAVAFIARSYWALIAGVLIGQCSRVVVGYTMHPYRPRLTLVAWRDIVGFSFWTWLLGIVGLIRDRSDSFFIGWWLNTTAVGVYAIGTEISDLPSSELVIPLAHACYTGFAVARHTGADTAKTYLRVIAVLALIAFPFGLGISLVADPAIKLAFGPRWADAIPIIEVLAIFCTMTFFGHISSALFSAHAMLSVMFRITVGSMLMRLALLAVLVPRFGLMGAVFAAGAPMLVEYTIYLVMTFKRFGLHAFDLVSNVWRSLLATTVMAGSLYALGLGWTTASGDTWALVKHLLLAVLVGATIYTTVVALSWAAAGRPAGAETDLVSFAIRKRLRSAGS